MNPTKLLVWVATILVACYMLGISPVGIITDVTHAIQTVHNSSTTTGRP